MIVSNPDLALDEAKATLLLFFSMLNEKQRRLELLQEWLVENIDYHQHYSEYIEGWRPHPAPQVFMRGYGDCKDKVALLCALLAARGAQVSLVVTRLDSLEITNTATAVAMTSNAATNQPAT